MQNLSFQYPSWFVLLAIVAAVGFSVILYYRSKPIGVSKSWIHPFLSVLRFLTVLTILVMLLGPIFKSIEEESKKPIVAIVQDNSQSIASWIEKSNDQGYLNDIRTTTEELNEKFEVDLYSFGGDITVASDSLGLNEPSTNIDKAINYISDIYEGENLAAVVVATDGIYNDGRNPIYSKFNHISPVYTVALGDTTQLNDLVLKNVLYNEIGYLNDQVQIQVDIQAYESNNKGSRLTIERKEGTTYSEIHSEDISIRSDDFFITKTVTLDLNTVGINQYRVNLSRLNNETNYQNNSKSIYIEVLDARQDILLIANAPHPDIAALKQILSKNKNYQISVKYDTPSAAELSSSDLVLFHNLPSSRLDIGALLETLDRRNTPRMYFVGGQTDLSLLNKLDPNLTIKGQSGATNNAEASFNEDFTNYTISEQLKKDLIKYPPVISPFGEYSFDKPASTLLYQNIGSIRTDFPLLSYVDSDNRKTAYFFGEGIWKWKYANHIENSNFQLISELIDKAVTYTSTKEDKRKFRANTSNKVYSENDNILLSAELYNNNYELINDPDVFLSIKNNEGNEFTYTFSPEGKSYTLNAGKLSANNYSYVASTTFNGEKLESQGRFSIGKLEYEQYDLEANHSVLHSISQKYNGKVFYPDQLSNLTETILSDQTLKPMIFQNSVNKSVLDFKWLFIWLAFLLILEWFLRRYFGTV